MRPRSRVLLGALRIYGICVALAVLIVVTSIFVLAVLQGHEVVRISMTVFGEQRLEAVLLVVATFAGGVAFADYLQRLSRD